MCEWLLSGEWCDVQILCSGRVFRAHRVVLASVSTFLKEILLTNSTNESQTLIILPDFDVDTVSSMLYYVYHGEAYVKEENLEKFYGIIKSLQIYIDDYFQPKNIGTNVKSNTDCLIRNVNLRLYNIEDVNTKMPTLYSTTYSTECDNLDKQIKLQNWTQLCKDPSTNLQSPNGNRQRNFFLRDSFVSAYHWNGTVNGGARSVLAISNEPYHAPSVLLKNINGKHLSIYKTLPEPNPRIINEQTPSAHLHSCDPGNSGNLCFTNMPHESYTHPTNSLENSTIFVKKDKNMGCGFRSNDSPNSLDSLQTKICRYNPPSTLDLRVKECISNNTKLFITANKNIQNASISEETNKQKTIRIKEESIVKPAILNKVLDSPWRARTPNTCKPYRRKLQHKIKMQLSNHNEFCNETWNDNNNNTESPIDETEEKSTETVVNAIALTPCTSKSEVDRDDMKCTVCDQVFTCNKLRDTHMKKHNQNARYTCVECGKSFSQLRNYKYHMSVHRGTREFAATCTICGKYFNDRGYLSSHMKIHRNRKEYKCSVCPKSFNQRVAYNMHVRIHTGVKPHSCEECGKAFSRKMLLKQHQRTHSGERPYACPHCDKRFADRSNMTLHLRLHTGVKPFSCSLCSKSFTKKHHLKSHLNFHTGAKPYSCPRCNLGFTQSSNMRTHLKKCEATVPAGN